METDELMNESCYKDSSIILTTKHAKSIAIAPAFLEKLGASIIEYVVDTDELGTFSGEVQRKGTALECARKKCEWSLSKLRNKVDFAIASEGSFGPHPLIPFFSCDEEILYFIDLKRDFHLYMSCISQKTNYRTEIVASLDDLYKFADEVDFPSHALIIRGNDRERKSPIFKGLNTSQSLEAAFRESIKYGEKGAVCVETDMRAQFNPSRMKVIAELAMKFCDRLKTYCPSCYSPGWGQINYEKGLPCSSCGSETELVKSEIFGCVKCDYQENRDRKDGKKEAGPENCQYCNP